MQNIIIIIYTSQEPMFALMIMKEQWETSTDNTHYSQAHTTYLPYLKGPKKKGLFNMSIERS